MSLFYSYRKIALSIIAINMLGAYERQANQPKVAEKSDVKIIQQSVGKDISHHHDETHHEHDEGVESILVLSTRLRSSVNHEPIRVEVTVPEELEEKAIMRPGNISMLVAETGGGLVQTRSPAYERLI
jgi:hypothetical protein